MEKADLENRIKVLQAEHEKGKQLLEDTKVRVLRIEGAILQLQDLLRECDAPTVKN